MKMHHGGRPLTEDEVRLVLLENVRLDGDCRIWAGSTGTYGLPVLTWGRQRYSGRRLLLTLLGRPPGARQVVWSTCGEKLCMNPDHLAVGTRAGLVRHMARHGKTSHGLTHSLIQARQRAACARISIARPQEMAALLADGRTVREIAEQYQVTTQRVYDAIKRMRELGLLDGFRELRDAA